MDYYQNGQNPYGGGFRPNPYQQPRNNMNPNGPNYYGYQYQCAPNTKPYVVVAGDTLYSIAMRYSTTVDEILMYNQDITDPDRIYIGQVICIPCDGIVYTIKPGDTLYSIAMKYDITIDEILAANPDITNPNLIYPGQKICLPADSTCPPGLSGYYVQPNDTLTTILTNTQVSLNTLKGANPTFDEENIVPGTQLCVISTPCAPQCDKSKQCTIPDKVVGLVAVAEYYVVSTNDLLKCNPNYPPCYYKPGHTICVPPEVPV